MTELHSATEINQSAIYQSISRSDRPIGRSAGARGRARSLDRPIEGRRRSLEWSIRSINRPASGRSIDRSTARRPAQSVDCVSAIDQSRCRIGRSPDRVQSIDTSLRSDQHSPLGDRHSTNHLRATPEPDTRGPEIELGMEIFGAKIFCLSQNAAFSVPRNAHAITARAACSPRPSSTGRSASPCRCTEARLGAARHWPPRSPPPKAGARRSGCHATG